MLFYEQSLVREQAFRPGHLGGLTLEQGLLGGIRQEDERANIRRWPLGLRAAALGRVIQGGPGPGWAWGTATWQGAPVTGHPSPPSGCCSSAQRELDQEQAPKWRGRGGSCGWN